MNNKLEMTEKVNSIFSAISRYYNKKIEEIMDSTPESFTSSYLEKDSDDPFFNMETRHFNKSFEPKIEQKLIDFLSNQLTREEVLFTYDDLKYKSYGYFKKRIKEIIELAYGEKDIVSFDAVQMASCHWIDHKRFSNEDTLTIYDSLTKDLKTPFNDKRFSAKLIHSNLQAGMTNEQCTNEEFLTTFFDEDIKEYKEFKNKRLFLDAKLAILFHFKNKPAFMVSFFIDKNKNIFIRQIQGFKKGRGHYVLGSEWQKTVVEYLKNNLSFSNKTYVITEKAALESLFANYKDELRPFIMDTIIKASNIYKLFKNDNVVKVQSNMFLDFYNTRKINDVFYRV